MLTNQVIVAFAVSPKMLYTNRCTVFQLISRKVALYYSKNINRTNTGDYSISTNPR